MSTPDALRLEHAEWDALAVGWALSALDPRDEARFAAHLPDCHRCADTVRESLGTVTELAYAVPMVSPPRQLRRRILEAAAADARRADLAGPAGRSAADHRVAADGPAGGRGSTDAGGRGSADHYAAQVGYPAPGNHAAADVTGYPAPDNHPAADVTVTGYPAPGNHPMTMAAPRHRVSDRTPGGPPADPGTVVPLASRRRRWAVRTAVAAALALIAGLGAWNVELRSRQDDLQQIVAQRDALVARLTEAGPAEIAIIQGSGDDDSRYATVVVKQGRIGLITETLPPVSGTTTYWLWSLRSDKDQNPVPLAGFTVPSTRFSACNIEPPAGLDAIRAFAISREPGPQRPARPTTLIGSGLATDR